MKVLARIKETCIGEKSDYSAVGIHNTVMDTDTRAQYKCNILLLTMIRIKELKDRLSLLKDQLSTHDENTPAYLKVQKSIKRMKRDIKEYKKIKYEYVEKLTARQYAAVLRYL